MCFEAIDILVRDRRGGVFQNRGFMAGLPLRPFDRNSQCAGYYSVGSPMLQNMLNLALALQYVPGKESPSRETLG